MKGNIFYHNHTQFHQNPFRLYQNSFCEVIASMLGPNSISSLKAYLLPKFLQDMLHTSKVIARVRKSNIVRSERGNR